MAAVSAPEGRQQSTDIRKESTQFAEKLIESYNYMGVTREDFSAKDVAKQVFYRSCTGKLWTLLTEFRDRSLSKFDFYADLVENIDSQCDAEIKALGKNPERKAVQRIEKSRIDQKKAKVREFKEETGIELQADRDLAISIGKRAVCAVGYTLLTGAAVVEFVFRLAILSFAYVLKALIPKSMNKGYWTEKALFHLAKGVKATGFSVLANGSSIVDNFFGKTLLCGTWDQRAGQFLKAEGKDPERFETFGTNNEIREVFEGIRRASLKGASARSVYGDDVMRDLDERALSAKAQEMFRSSMDKMLPRRFGSFVE